MFDSTFFPIESHHVNNILNIIVALKCINTSHFFSLLIFQYIFSFLDIFSSSLATITIFNQRESNAFQTQRDSEGLKMV